MDVVHNWLIDAGHDDDDIRDTSDGNSYDFEIGPQNRPVMRVEVKRLTGRLGPVTVTRGEVESARGPIPTMLAVVHGIQVEKDEDAVWRGWGGKLWVANRWKPDDGELEATQFRYSPRGGWSARKWPSEFNSS